MHENEGGKVLTVLFKKPLNLEKAQKYSAHASFFLEKFCEYHLTTTHFLKDITLNREGCFVFMVNLC